MELQIQHSNSENDRAFVSILLKKQSSSDSVEMDNVLNKFMFELYALRSQHKFGFKNCMDVKHLNLENILTIKPDNMKGLNMTYFTY